jgi:hypothetical protein
MDVVEVPPGTVEGEVPPVEGEALSMKVFGTMPDDEREMRVDNLSLDW